MGAMEGSKAGGVTNMEKEHVPFGPNGCESGYVEEMVWGSEENRVFGAEGDSGDVGVVKPGIKARRGQGRDEKEGADGRI